MKKNKILLAALALALVLCVGVGSAMAYFSASSYATGGVTLNLGFSTEIDEPNVSGGVKHVVVTNTGNVAVWVRVRAFSGDDSRLAVSGSGWTAEDGWYVYGSPLAPAAVTDELLVDFSALIPEGEEIAPEDSSFSVVVVHEAVPVTYDEDGEPVTEIDWSGAVEVVKGGQ